MFEAERVLMSDNVVIPIYSYVTKRLVNPHLQGWQPNVMDHHLTRYMFKLRSRQAGDEPAAAPAALEPASGLTPLEDLPLDDAVPVDPAVTAPQGASGEGQQKGDESAAGDVPQETPAVETAQPREGDGR